MKLESSVSNDDNSCGIKRSNNSSSNDSHHERQSAIIARDAVRATSEAVALMLQDLCRTAASEAIRRKRKTISYDDLARAVTLYDRFAYLANIIPAIPEVHRTDHKCHTSKLLQPTSNTTTEKSNADKKTNSTHTPCETSSNK